MYKRYFRDGQLEEICSYTDGKKNGEYKEYYINGQLDIICSYIDDEMYGMYKYYYEDGELRYTCYNKNWLIYIITIYL